ncbi:MAG: tRNA lysidine(34) synthetase TilS, partial [Chloroflexi bacterium]|nr:tRNA lysidine(34) synthetase TilS [Chloroflexota bacterium]
HTADDQVETILMHLVRGSGLAGLAGMSSLGYWPSPTAERKIALVRPLLEVSRAETEAYCRQRGVTPREDPTNQSPQFTRNRVRSDLIPRLMEYNPRFLEALLRLGRSAARDQEYLVGQASIAREGLAKATKEGFEIDRMAFNSLPAALRAQLLRLLYQETTGSMRGLESRHLEDMIRLSGGRVGTHLDLPQGLAFFVGYHTMKLGSARGETYGLPPLVGEHPLEVPGQTLFPGGKVQARLGGVYEAFDDLGGNVARLDKEAAGGHLRVRGRRAGDRLQPLGMATSKKLQDFLVDAKVPRAMRDGIPLVVSERGIVWVVGHRIAHWARVTGDTREVLELRFSPTSST